LEVHKIKEFIESQKYLLQSIIQSNKENFESSKFLVDLTYGQVIFTIRNDAFIQANYLPRLPFGKKKFTMFPIEGYQIVGPAPLPRQFQSHIRKFLENHPDKKSLYSHLLNSSY
jgi:hypothetical protein